MFTPKTPTEKSGLEEAIDEVLHEMALLTADDKAYAAMVVQLVKLYSLKDVDRPKRVSPDTLAIITGNVIVTAMIVGYERANVVTSKALSFLQKLR